MSQLQWSEKLQELRQQIKFGADALSHGYFIELGDAELDEYLERLADRGDQKSP